MTSLLHRFGFLVGVLSLTGANDSLSASSGIVTIQLADAKDAKELQLLDADSIMLSNGSLTCGNFFTTSMTFNGIEFIAISPSNEFVFNNVGGSVKINTNSDCIIKRDCESNQITSISKNVQLLAWNQSLLQLPNDIYFEYDDNNQIHKITDGHGLGFYIYYNENSNINNIINDSGNVIYDFEKADFLFPTITEKKEEPSDKITLVFCGAGSYEYHKISYYKTSENSWNFSYERELRDISF